MAGCAVPVHVAHINLTRFVALVALVLVMALVALSPGLAAPAWAAACPAGGSHDYEAELITPATDDADGLQRFTCNKCGKSYEKAIPATGHAWGPWRTVEKATCTSSGIEQRVCANNPSHVQERATPPLSGDGSHAWVETSRVNATCETSGEAHYRCERCDAQLVEETPALGHDWGPWETTLPATTNREGIERRVCTRDANHAEERTIPPIVEEAKEEPPAPVAEEPEKPAAETKEATKTAEPPSPEPPEAKPMEASAPEAVDPWAPNALDAVLLGIDIAGAIAFTILIIPLIHARRWVLNRRAEAKERAWRQR